MPVPYTNPYNSQLCSSISDVFTFGTIPIPPCTGAYSVGPQAADTSITVRWISANFNFTSTVNTSRCGLIKDENDVFYYITAHRPSSTTSIFVEVYDAPNDTEDFYTLNTPAELADLNTTLRNWHWFIRKNSETELDFVVIASDSDNSDRIIQHYTWTIGDEDMTYVGGYSYVFATIGNPIATTLHGPQIIEMVVHATDYTSEIVTYNLDTQSGSSTTLLANPENNFTEFRFYHGGLYVYCMYFAEEKTGTAICEGHLGAPTEVTMGVKALMYGFQFYLDGTYDEIGNDIKVATGYHSAISVPDVSQEHSANPDTGEVYFRLALGYSYSSLVGCPVPYQFSAEFSGEYKGYFKLPNCTAYQEWEVEDDHGEDLNPQWELINDKLSYPAYWTAGAGPDTFYQANKYSFPSRNDPMSLTRTFVTGSPDTTWFLLHWPSLDCTAEDVFYPTGSGLGNSTYETDGAGQRNDNSPEIISSKYKDPDSPFTWHNVWLTDGGAEYLDQDSGIGGTSTNFLPVNGFIGKWPVRHHIGRWAIFSPNTPPVDEGWARWYVV